MGRLEGKVAIVTGAARGHAEAVARRFAKEGAAVSICDVIPVPELEAKVGSEIRAAGWRRNLFSGGCLTRNPGQRDGHSHDRKIRHY